MTGMKAGAGEDPFADDEEDTSADTESTTEPERKDRQSSTDSKPVDTPESGRQQLEIPYKFRRDGVQDGRDRVPLFLHSETKSAERDALRELEDRFDDDVSLTDLREALVKVGLENIDDVEEQLESWGYGMTFK
jgi:hypothetical protein